jgi:hypothetical protein
MSCGRNKLRWRIILKWIFMKYGIAWLEFVSEYERMVGCSGGYGNELLGYVTLGDFVIR